MLCQTALVLLVVAPAGGDWIGDWESYRGHYYRLTAEMRWDEAEALAVGVGSHLVTINDAAENQWIAETFLPVTNVIALGLYQPPEAQEPDGGWQWISGEPVTFTNWEGGFPEDPVGDKDLAILLKPPATWIDYDGYRAVSLVEMVPEPATVFLVTLGGFALLCRRRRTTWTCHFPSAN